MFGVYRTNSRVIASGRVCNNAFGLFNIALGGLNVRYAFMGPGTDRRRVRGTFHPGAGIIFNRAVDGPNYTILSVRGFTHVTRGGNIPLVMSGAFTAPVGYHPFR